MVGSMTVQEENTLPFARIPRFPNKPTHPATRCFHPKHLPGEGGDSLLGLGTGGHLAGTCQCHLSLPSVWGHFAAVMCISPLDAEYASWVCATEPGTLPKPRQECLRQADDNFPSCATRSLFLREMHIPLTAPCCCLGQQQCSRSSCWVGCTHLTLSSETKRCHQPQQQRHHNS